MKKVKKRWLPLVVFLVVSVTITIVGCQSTLTPTTQTIEQETTKNGQAGTTLSAEKTATGYYKREIVYDWTITKEASPSTIDIPAGESATITYKITATRKLVSENESYGVSGNISVKNGGAVATKDLAITDKVMYQPGGGPHQELKSFSVDVSSNPVLDPQETGVYPYDIPFEPVAGAKQYKNDAHITITNHSGHLGKPFGPSPDYGFSLPTDPTLIETDERATITDTFGTFPDWLFITGDNGPWTLEDTRTIEYTVTLKNISACGMTYDLTNTATLEKNDTGETRTASSSVEITTGTCELTPCTLTFGYWKTHSRYGPAKPRNDTWDEIGENTTFYLSEQSYYQVLWTSPKGGNVYYILAHQYIAAKLNILNGAASTSEVDDALAWAETFFNTYKPTSNFSKTVKAQATAYATTLDNYNNGFIGPGHCP